ncbi:MAG: hypothetical protein ACI85F_002640 [Bacteroidia bacterium]|jgi:hypothetical protein
MKYWLKLFAPGLGFVLFIACAQIVTPSGGPKDELPPLILEMNPEPFNTNFSGNTIEIEFDEYIKLHEPANQILISPPQQKSPEYLIKKKNLIVKFKDSLLENTTYTINFGEAIRDNNEGNVLGRLTYVFSTGSYLDSMQVQGKVVNAIDGSAAEEILVMLYDQDVDSLPLDTLPRYFARTDEQGNFKLSNLKNTDYKVFALKDENANYIYDNPEESIAFLDSMVTPDLAPARPDTAVLDSSSADSMNIEIDELELDSSKVEKVEMDSLGLMEDLAQHHELFMFVEADTAQYLKKASASGLGQLLFEYNLPVKEFRVLPVTSGLPRNWRLKEYSSNRDSINLWLRDVQLDSLELLIQADAGKIDTVELALARLDTTPAKASGSGGLGKKGRKTKDDGKMKVEFGGNGRSPKPTQPMQLTTNHPVSKLNVDSISIFQDSTEIPFQMHLYDSTLRRFELIYDQIPEKRYEIEILTNAFTDMRGVGNIDTITTGYKAMLPDELGNVDLVLTVPDSVQIIVQVLDQSQKIIHEEQLKGSGTVLLTAVTPGKYSLKAIFDKNGNGKWDTGRYNRKLQPEQAVFYPLEIEVRENWDLETEWDLTKLIH